MSSAIPSTTFGGNGDVEMSPCDVQSILLEDQPLDLRIVTKLDSEERTQRSSFQRQTAVFLNAPLMKNVPMPVAEIKPFGSPTLKPTDLSNTKSLQPLQLPIPAINRPMEIVPADSTILESKTKVALKFCLRKCGELSLYFRSSSRKVVAPTNCRFQSLITSLKNTVKSLAKTMPSTTNVISQIQNSVVKKIKVKRMQDYVKLFSLTFTPWNRRKKIKASVDALPALSTSKRPDEATFVNPTKKPELQHLAGFQFAKPKFYECSYCDTRFYKLPIYIKHIRRHAEIITCDTCWKAFSSVINKRRHQLQCHQRTMMP